MSCVKDVCTRQYKISNIRRWFSVSVCMHISVYLSLMNTINDHLDKQDTFVDIHT